MSARVSETETHKKRKGVEKTVVRVRIEANVGKLKNEGMPLDVWSWRKYGQKPIKGSPYPRGYYRCSTSKGCSAKKQVEKCRTDASLLIITYISSHNHPINNQTKPGKHEQENDQFGCLKTSSKEMHMDCVSDEPVISSSCCSTSASKEYLEEGNDFFDDLEELPMFSGFAMPILETTMFGALGFRSSPL